MNWRTFDRDAVLFSCAYFIVTALSFCSLTANYPVTKAAAAFVMVWGAAHIVRGLILWRQWRRDILFWLAAAFFASALVSSIFNIRYGVSGNIKMLVWMALELFVLLPNLRGTDVKRRRRKRRIFYTTVVITTFALSLISFLMLAANYSGAAVARGQYMGVMEGRLWGSYSDPNYGAMLALCSIIIAAALLYSGSRGNGRGMRIFLWIDIFLQYVYITYSFSRTGKICLVITTAVFAVLIMRRTWYQTSWIRKLIVIAILLILLFPAMNWMRSGYNAVHGGRQEGVASAQEEANGQEGSSYALKADQPAWQEARQLMLAAGGDPAGDTTAAEPEAFTGAQTEAEAASAAQQPAPGEEGTAAETTFSGPDETVEETLVTAAGGNETTERETIETTPSDGMMHREDELSDDVTNGRKAIWKEAIEIWKTKPIFGISYRNISSYLEAHFPDGYMNSLYNHLNTFHNMFIDVLVSQGLVGEIILLMMLAVVLIRLVKIIRRYLAGSGRSLLPLLPVLLVGILGISALLLTEIFYINTPTAVLFWVSLSFINARFGAGEKTVRETR